MRRRNSTSTPPINILMFKLVGEMAQNCKCGTFCTGINFFRIFHKTRCNVEKSSISAFVLCALTGIL